jgi:cytochrome c
MTLRFPLLLAIGLTAALSACGPKKEAGAGGPPAETAAPADPAAKAMVATLPAPFNGGDPVAGQAVFARCRTCHTTDQGAPNMTGPNLWGLFGRKPGSRTDYGYSDGMKAQAYVWDAPHLDKWLANPRGTVPGTKMSFIGLNDPKERIDVIAYLKTATEPKPAAPAAAAAPAKK